MKLFSTKDAAEYIKLSLPAIKYHIRQKNITGKIIGNSLVFTKDELDHFQANRRKQGRPKRKS